MWLEHDYRFRVRRERTDAPWNLFNYPLYSSVKAKCKAKAANTYVSSQPFREYASGSTLRHSSRFCFAFNKGKCQRPDCRYTHGCSVCQNERHSQLVCRGKAKPPTTEHITEPPQKKQVEITTRASNDLLIEDRFTRSGSGISTPINLMSYNCCCRDVTQI